MSVKQPPAMAKAKETKSSIKKKDAPAKKAKPSSKSAVSHLSEEKIVDSDSENEAPPAKAATKVKETPKKTITTPKAVVTIKAPTSNAKVGDKNKVESSSDESSEESEDETPTSKKLEKAPAKTNGVKRKAKESKEEESDEEESESEPEPPAKKAKTSPEADVKDSSSEEEGSSNDGEVQKLAKAKAKAKSKKAEPASDVDMKDSSSEEEEDSSEESEEEEQVAAKTKEKGKEKPNKTKPAPAPAAESSSEEEEEDESNEPSAKAVPTTTRRKDSSAPTASAVESIPAKPFEPPSGYASLEVSNPTSASLFASEDFSGKQIWHITAPSNIPIKSITEVALEAVKSSKPVLNHKGMDYVLAEDKNHSTKFNSVFVPATGGYRSVEHTIDTTLHLQQKIELPNLTKLQADINKGSNAAADVAQAAVSDARPQPKGLRMRYKPPGFGRGDPGRVGAESDSSDEEASRQRKPGKSLQFPKALGAHGAFEKSDGPTVEKTKKSKNKHRDSDVEMANGDSSMPPPSSTTPQKKKKKQATEGAEDEAPVGASPSGESKEEKAKRKEMKRLKKEARKAKGGAD